MVEFTAAQRRDIGLARGFGNMTYAEIAAYINAKHGLTVSDDQVGRVVRGFEARIEAGESLEYVAADVAATGGVDDVLALLAGLS